MAARAIYDQNQRSVQVKREELIKTLEKNKEQHVKNYELAKAGYREVLLKKIEEAFGNAMTSLKSHYESSKHRIQNLTDDQLQKQNDYLTLVNAVQVEMKVPRCYAKEYDIAIDIAKWDVRDVLELSSAEFQCFVRDVWEWSDDFQTTSAMYVGQGR